MRVGSIPAKRRSGALAVTAALLATAAVTMASAASAQDYVWGGDGSTTATTDYNLVTNWSTTNAGAPPVNLGQTAVFGATGNATINVGPMYSSSSGGDWRFAANAQSYTVTGGYIGLSGSLVNEANSGQTITMGAYFSAYGCGCGYSLRQDGNSTLVLAAGGEFYNGIVSKGTLAIQSTVNGGSIQNDANLVVSGAGSVLSLFGYFTTGVVDGSVSSTTITGQSFISVYNGFLMDSGVGSRGTLNILDGSGLVSTNGVLAHGAGSQSTVTVDGVGSQWMTGYQMHIGMNGTATLTVSNGGHVTAYAGPYCCDPNGIIYLGTNAGATGTALVTGAGSLMHADYAIEVGSYGTGRLTVADGAKVEAYSMTAGTYTGATGTIIVNGAGSAVSLSNDLLIGSAGTGTLTLANGGRIGDDMARVPSTYFGLDAGGIGHGTITGAGSVLYSTSTYVGHSGTGTLTLAGGGKLVGGWLYLGYAPGSSGTLNIGAASGAAPVAPGEFAAFIIFPTINGGASTIVFNHTSSNYAFSAVILGYGMGPSTIIVENGTTNFGGLVQGATTVQVNGGRLNFHAGGADTDVTVNSGGTLGGHGGVKTVTVNAGGTFVSDGMATLSDFTMNVGSTYRYTANLPTTVGGVASLGGANLSFKAMSFTDQTYTVLTATGGVTGTFNLVPEGTTGTAVYNPNDVQLTVKGYRAGTALMGAGGNVNVVNLVRGIDRALDAGGTPQPGFDALLGVTGANLAAALNKLTGEAGTGASSTGLTGASTFLGIMLDPMGGSRGGAASAPGSSLIEMADLGSARTPAERVEAAWSIWTRAYGQAGRTASDAGLGAAGTASSIYGVAAGADKLISPGLVVGFALAGGGTSFGLGTLGSGTGDFAQIGAYASMRLGPGYLSGAIAYGWNRLDVTRNVAALGVTETYRSGPVGHTFGGRIEAGRRFALGNLGTMRFAVTPYAAAEAIAYLSPGYRESWAAPATGAFALTYGSRTTGTLRAELGARADALVASAESGDLIAFSRLAYDVQTNTQRAAEAQFQALAGSTFTVFGARASTHTALGTLGIEARYRQGLTASVALDGEVGDRHRALRGSVGLRQSW